MESGASEDYYALLGIDAAADDLEIRRAWRRLALKWHPDRAGPGATATFQRILSAYMVLSDAEARALYDLRRRGPAPVRPRAPGVLLHRLSGALGTLLGCGVARLAAGNVIELLVNAEEATQGGMVSISMTVPVRCAACEGAHDRSCKHCHTTRVTDELFSAWLAVRPGVADGTVLKPSVALRGMLRPVIFKVRRLDAI